MGKRSRQKLEKRRMRLTPIAIVHNPKNTLKARTAKFFKNKVAIYGLSAGLALGLGLKYREAIPYWVGVEKPYKLGMVFEAHTKSQHALPVIEELKWAREHQQPYHVMLVEASGFDKREMNVEVRAMNNKVAILRNKYEEMVRSGLNKEQAREQLRTLLRNNTNSQEKGNDFRNEIYLGLAIERVRMMPAEAYEPKMLERINRMDRVINEKETVLDAKLATNSPLAEIHKAFIETNKAFYELASIRDAYSRKNMHKLIESARKLFPELAKQREIRFLTQFGSFHRKGLNPEHCSNKKTEAYEVKGKPTLSVAGYAGRVSAGNDFQRMSMFDTLGYYLDDTLREMQFGNPAKNIPNRPDLAKRIYQRAIRTTPEEFDALSRMNYGLDYNQRANYLLNYFAMIK